MTSAFAVQLNGCLGRHRRNGILLDTNVLLLLVVSQFQPSLIGGKRLEKYVPDDAELLAAYVGQFDRILTTSHILAETSNLASQALSGRRKLELFAELFPLFCMGPNAFHQCSIESARIDPITFTRYGLTDAGVVLTAGANGLLLTDDLDLHLAALKGGADSINFTHMREAAGLL